MPVENPRKHGETMQCCSLAHAHRTLEEDERVAVGFERQKKTNLGSEMMQACVIFADTPEMKKPFKSALKIHNGAFYP